MTLVYDDGIEPGVLDQVTQALGRIRRVERDVRAGRPDCGDDPGDGVGVGRQTHPDQRAGLGHVHDPTGQDGGTPLQVEVGEPLPGVQACSMLPCASCISAWATRSIS